jgi:hypothetical protein
MTHMSDDFLDRFPPLRALFGEALPLPALGPGNARAELKPQLAAIDLATLFAGRKITDPALAQCCVSGLWLLADFLDESHTISQEISTPEGSYWHGIMHRREPDYDNAKYWFRRVPRHPIHEPLGEAARALFAAARETDPYAEFLEHMQPWDASAFVDLCAAIARGKARCETLARQVAWAEWRLLFEHCYAGAVA